MGSDFMLILAAVNNVQTLNKDILCVLRNVKCSHRVSLFRFRCGGTISFSTFTILLNY